MGQQIVQVDAFTDRPFAGNPAAVCLLEAPREADWMQQVAQEMNLAETAFVVPEQDGFALRWFTPTIEVDLCGHATLAAAHVLWESGRLAPEIAARFHTKSGLLTAKRNGDWIELDFPAEPESPVEAPPDLIESLGVTPLYVGRNRFDYLIEVENESVVRGLQPDYTRLGKVATRGVMVTSRSASSDYDFVSRFFGPSAGINEDPVTGSAHCCLGPYWQKKLGKDAFVAYQSSPRGGVVRVHTAGDRVLLGGQAVTTLRGELSETASR